MTHGFNAKHTLAFGDGDATVYRLDELDKAGLTALDKLPFSIRVLLENVVRAAAPKTSDDGAQLPLFHY